MGAQPQCLGSIHLAACCGHATGPHGGGAVQLSPQSSHRPWAHNASDKVQGDGQGGDILMCGMGPCL